jgi:hypothetical protein
LGKKTRIDLQLHGPAATAENPSEIWESRILPLALDVDVDVGDNDDVESAGSVPPPDEVSLVHDNAEVVQ